MPCLEEQTHLCIKNILLATDFSESSEATLPYALGLAQRYGSTIFVAHVISSEAEKAIPPQAMRTGFDEVRYFAGRAMVAFLGSASLGGIPHEALLERGSIPEAICEIVRNRQVDLVVIGTHDQKLRKFNIGSTAEEILRMVPCPVLIIGPEVTHTELAKGALERIVYVTDFSTSSLDALPYAVALAQDNEAQLTLVHVAEETTMGPFYYGNSRSVAFRKRLESLVPASSGFLCESEFVVGYGDRAEGLVRVAANLNASLIVMIVRGTPAGASARVLWPVDGQVICRAHGPVLMVRG
jgi:nucleotide-binding universal stress UspA family protein